MRFRTMLLCLFSSYLLMTPISSFAGIDLPWSTTFGPPNCTADWTEGGSLSCDGMSAAGGWTPWPYVYYPTDNVTHTYNFNFGIDNPTSPSSIGVSCVIAPWTDVTLTQGADYTVSCPGNNCSSGGSITITNPCPTSTYVRTSIWPTAPTPRGEQITSAANNSSGGGGKGERHWVGDGGDNNSGGLSISFNNFQTEFWVRWYMRYQAGFQWESLLFDKWLYIRSSASSAVSPVVEPLWGLRSLSITEQGATSAGSGNINGNYFQSCCTDGAACSPGNNATTGCGWQDWMGGTTSDGNWHWFEVHMKMDTTNTPDWNGVAQMWADGAKVIDTSNVNFSNNDATMRRGWDSIQIATNQSTPNNGMLMAVDWDDIAISNTGFIGPAGSPGQTLAPPANIRVVH